MLIYIYIYIYLLTSYVVLLDHHMANLKKLTYVCARFKILNFRNFKTAFLRIKNRNIHIYGFFPFMVEFR
jgi:hypothetical protein